MKFIKLAKELFPIHRSITGTGVRKTLRIIKTKHLPDLKIKKVKSGTKVFDWKIPPEWNIKDAYLKDESGKKIIDYKNNNLHVISYSKKINRVISRKELNKHLFSIANKPQAIPYITSYYKPFWGFCIAHKDRKKIKGKKFFAHINSTHNNRGYLNYGELYLRGDSTKEILITTYICHPSLANNEISGPVVSTFLAKHFKKIKKRYSIRFIFIPETIGSILYISKNLEKLKKNVIAGYNLTCIGDERNYSFIPTRHGNTLSDRAALEAFRKLKIKFKHYSFLDRGGDERQFNSPNIDIPVAVLMRTRFGDYPEYHTSLDNFNLVSEKGLKGGFKIAKKAIDIINTKTLPITNIACEPMISKRKLQSTISTGILPTETRHLKNFLAYCDGKNDLDEIRNIIKISRKKINKILRILVKKKLIKICFETKRLHND
tara:strand:- start:50 stop:1345 length:1296 start_codon:yes stop_codon:yes gene_type:complete